MYMYLKDPRFLYKQTMCVKLSELHITGATIHVRSMTFKDVFQLMHAFIIGGASILFKTCTWLACYRN